MLGDTRAMGCAPRKAAAMERGTSWATELLGMDSEHCLVDLGLALVNHGSLLEEGCLLYTTAYWMYVFCVLIL